MSVTLRQLKILNAVVKNCQVTKVTKLLFITQSAVSLALIEMENQVGREHCLTAREETLTSMKEDSLLVTAFESMHPNVHVNMLVCNTGAAEKLILNSQVDLGLRKAKSAMS